MIRIAYGYAKAFCQHFPPTPPCPPSRSRREGSARLTLPPALRGKGRVWGLPVCNDYRNPLAHSRFRQT